uniref:Ankyrin repeat protein n=1 Tax=Pithovirus LCPAC401 TaxID=2506595 RepID=A0A481ZBQ8_9VIRU|nr:MAG: ankyrin repeat protein [Pithovirus LCPAC401]
MNVLRDYLDEDSITVILANGDKYDIKLLSKKITGWNGCAQWASRKGHLNVLKYIRSLELPIRWIMCINYASFYGNTECVDFVFSDILTGNIEEFDRMDCFYYAIEGGNLEIVKILEPKQGEDIKPWWGDYMAHAARFRHLELVKHFGKKYIDSGMNHGNVNQYMKEVKKGGDFHIIEYMKTIF